MFAWLKRKFCPRRADRKATVTLDDVEREFEELRQAILKTPFVDEGLKARLEKKKHE